MTAGTSGTGNNFAELVPASLAGYAYIDANNNGAFDSGETAIAGATVTLTGTNDLGNSVHLSTTSAVNGAYSFSNLRPGTYTLTETRPTGYIDGDDSIGSQGGTVGVSSFSNVDVVSGTNGVNNNFANLVPASLSGVVFLDSNDNGILDNGEGGIAGASVALAGTNDLGAAVSLTTTTTSNGAYSFNNLAPGTYTLAVTQPSGYLAGTDSIGSLGGTVGSGMLSNISLALGVGGSGNNFAELRAASLSGFAYVDANANGTFDAGETPLSGVIVALSGYRRLEQPGRHDHGYRGGRLVQF